MPWLEKLSDRYLFTGRLVMESGLHIGGGRDALTTTDSAVMKYIDDRPFIPGSSMKGAFRSAVERTAGSLPRVRSCGLSSGNDESCPTPKPRETDAKEVSDETLADLCHTCVLFGSPFMAAKVRFSDLPVIPATWAGITEVRDGVGIDRDSERAVAQIKYDYEVVPSETEFDFRLVLENPDAERRELGLVAVGLRELEAGMIPIGGIRTRGLGRCRLADLAVYHLQFNNPAKFKAYLKGGRLESDDFKLSAEDADGLLNNAIDGLFE
jgi:CRISPR-associated RAMP protein (TIGR02581 family)